MSTTLGKEMEKWEKGKLYKAGREVIGSGNYKTKMREF
jgi:hypothetical protein